MIDQIRTVRGFDTFLRPLPIRDLAAAAADGPIVVVNVLRSLWIGHVGFNRTGRPVLTA